MLSTFSYILGQRILLIATAFLIVYLSTDFPKATPLIQRIETKVQKQSVKHSQFTKARHKGYWELIRFLKKITQIKGFYLILFLSNFFFLCFIYYVFSWTWKLYPRDASISTALIFLLPGAFQLHLASPLSMIGFLILFGLRHLIENKKLPASLALALGLYLDHQFIFLVPLFLIIFLNYYWGNSFKEISKELILLILPCLIVIGLNFQPILASMNWQTSAASTHLIPALATGNITEIIQTDWVSYLQIILVIVISVLSVIFGGNFAYRFAPLYLCLWVIFTSPASIMGPYVPIAALGMTTLTQLGRGLFFWILRVTFTIFAIIEVIHYFG